MYAELGKSRNYWLWYAQSLNLICKSQFGKGKTMKKERVNDKLEVAVNRGIAAILMQGLSEGIKVMKDNQVPVEIVARVALSPSSRRSTDWKL